VAGGRRRARPLRCERGAGDVRYAPVGRASGGA